MAEGSVPKMIPYKVAVKISSVKFADCKFPVLLKVGWWDSGVALETRWKNAPGGEARFKKKLKRTCRFSKENVIVTFLITQKVGVGAVTVGWTKLDLTPCFLESGKQFFFIGRIQGTYGRQALLEASATMKKIPEHQMDFKTVGSTTASSQNITLCNPIEPFPTSPLLSFEDVYMHALKDSPHLFALNFILEHQDLASTIQIDEQAVEEMEEEELDYAHRLLLSLNLFQEKGKNYRYLILPSTFDLGAFKRVLLHYQQSGCEDEDPDVIEHMDLG